jgi:oligosaccharide repeat unit polymerase
MQMIFLNSIILGVLLSIIFYRYKRTGVLLTPSIAALAMNMIVPVYAVYPFQTTRKSLEEIGQLLNVRAMSAAVNELWFVVTVGTAIGIVAYILAPRVFPRLFARASQPWGSHRTGLADLVTGACLSTLSGAGLIWAFFAYTGTITMLSPDPVAWRVAIGVEYHVGIYVLGCFLSVTGATFLLAGLALKRIHCYKPFCYFALCVWAVTVFLTASRTPLFLPFVLAALIFFSVRAKDYGLTRISVWGVAVIVSLAFMQAVRHGHDPTLSGAMNELTYGSTLCALRDNAWVQMAFERGRYPLYWGKTIVAGFMTFVPSRWSPFKQTYSWGVVTRTLVNYRDPYSLSGLGSVWFGDWYINFGYPGVVIEALLMGLVFRLFDTRLLNVLSSYKRSGKYDYYSVYKVWFFWLVASMAFASGSSDFVEPFLVGFLIMIAVAKWVRLFAGRMRRDSPVPPMAVGRVPHGI